MEIVLYTAMTAAEFEKNSSFSSKIAWMACHFSPYGTGLSNLPTALPKGSLLILNDRTPICGHDPALIAAQLEEIIQAFGCSGLLLDFQRPGAEAVAATVSGLSCKVAVTPAYAQALDCAVFLPPPPLTVPFSQHISPWQGREIWVEAALERICIRVTTEGSREIEASPFPCPHVDETLHCRYGIHVQPQQIDFHLHRDAAALSALMEEGSKLGITQYVGLYQQLGAFSSQATAQDTARFQL